MTGMRVGNLVAPPEIIQAVDYLNGFMMYTAPSISQRAAIYALRQAEEILRETLEETGLTLTDWRYRGIVTFVSDRWETEYMHLFTATGWTGRLHECDEGVLEWVSREQFRGLPQWEGDRIFLRLIEEDAPFFSLKLRYEGEHLAYAALNGKELAR